MGERSVAGTRASSTACSSSGRRPGTGPGGAARRRGPARAAPAAGSGSFRHRPSRARGCTSAAPGGNARTLPDPALLLQQAGLVVGRPPAAAGSCVRGGRVRPPRSARSASPSCSATAARPPGELGRCERQAAPAGESAASAGACSACPLARRPASSAMHRVALGVEKCRASSSARSSSPRGRWTIASPARAVQIRRRRNGSPRTRHPGAGRAGTGVPVGPGTAQESLEPEPIASIGRASPLTARRSSPRERLRPSTAAWQERRVDPGQPVDPRGDHGLDGARDVPRAAHPPEEQLPQEQRVAVGALRRRPATVTGRSRPGSEQPG